MDNIICPDCGEETYIEELGHIGNWQFYQCDICDKRHWRNKGGITPQQLAEIRKGQLYAAMERDRNKCG